MSSATAAVSHGSAKSYPGLNFFLVRERTWTRCFGDTAAFDTAWEEGHAMPLDEAIATALRTVAGSRDWT
jgi:hypothetical protein